MEYIFYGKISVEMDLLTILRVNLFLNIYLEGEVNITGL